MPEVKISLASDNCSPAHPLVMQAVMQANEGVASAYGLDPWTERAEQKIREIFGKKSKIFMVPSGTGNNILALRIACRKFDSIICTDIAHIQFQETGAVEALVGSKLLVVPHKQGKVTLKELKNKLYNERAFGRHATNPRVLSITQPNEVGTVYSLEELKELRDFCKEEGLLLHVDGSRLYNAAVKLEVELEEMIEACGADLLSLGGTKNGLMGVECLVIFNPVLFEGSDFLQKQTLQLLSKMRFLSAQYIPFFTNNLWKDLARNANEKALEIAQFIQSIPQLELSYPVETNQIFFRAPAAWITKIQENISCYLWDHQKGEIRFIASWDTSKEDIVKVKKIFNEILLGNK